ncbi:MAG: DUF4435 domain-containing protein [Mesorhizobium sp.]|nr:DUF4435 domain-containing protein [Mesorhizobium sp.]
MTGYAERLRASTNTWSAAYIAFETGYLREQYRAYAFVEDEDDKVFYQLALTKYEDIRYLGCGGRNAVLSIYKKLEEEGKSQRALFFIDRDTELEPFDFQQEVLRTSLYSWESYVCQPDFVGWFLQRRTNPNLTSQEREEIVTGWNGTVAAFHDVLAAHTALCRTAFLLNRSLGVSEVVGARNATLSGIVLAPADDDPDSWFSSAVGLAIGHGAKKAEIFERIQYYSNTSLFATSQGKFLFSILRRFVHLSIRRLGNAMQGEFNSPKHWLAELPWNHYSLDYIRDYATARIGPA